MEVKDGVEVEEGRGGGRVESLVDMCTITWGVIDVVLLVMISHTPLCVPDVLFLILYF